ncbi:MAG TPA: tetratricopeptide repeat protein [Candidatus Ozemobacteraceae bacterium]|nr:tetratricopeptide repeat protein [Candidatus Ozemobacteraceae bacterium]HQG30159.1 tetratricopeptide repeat protein [Candidatus Ozemobacteraceae bacterium]
MDKRILLALALSVPTLLGLTGCSGGVGGEGSNTYSDTAGTPIVRSDTFNDKGWTLISSGQYESAISAFNQVLADNPTDDERAEANNGLGWARANLGSLSDGMPWFEKAIARSADAKVGLGAAYIQKGSKADLEMAVNLLYKQLGGENPHFHYVPRRATGVSDAEVHALLAYAFAALGQTDNAITQMEYAKELNPAYENTTIDQLGKMVDFLLR